jgi:hypothetical protein
MLADQFTAAAAAARNTAAVDEIARLTWRAHAEGQLPKGAFAALIAAVQAADEKRIEDEATPMKSWPRSSRSDWLSICSDLASSS